MDTVKILEHSSDKYTPRTYYNAKTAELIAAFAVDFSTAGEKCTHKAAGKNYASFPLAWNPCPLDTARYLYRYCKQFEVKVLNIAGNGIYTLSAKGWDQARINRFIYEVLKHMIPHYKLDKIISGGQTGVDFAAGVACGVLGIPCEMTLPKGFIQRFNDKKDVAYGYDKVYSDLVNQVKELNCGLL